MVACAIALGANLGNPQQTLEAAFQALNRPPDLHLVAQSHLYQTAPVGPPQPDYINACALVETTLPPPDLLKTLLQIEQQFGRVRRVRWGPRSLDLDLLFYGQQVIDTPTLQVPHPRLGDRAFVLVPLAEIAPDWMDPTTGHTVQTLSQAIDQTGVRRLDIAPP
ncbi:MAG: 2-amino-4-hydroxy-6-hydroxymethyldihydropteridine diphosphokinase [Leptolyngbya sp. LCM1.Bin17]|nr:MAG: 2-amino-4-hydroxy-6-hydroxymethyldihydropteridine diphosphokinase [Leptolyngbya sp. LCM1.Bin17]